MTIYLTLIYIMFPLLQMWSLVLCILSPVLVHMKNAPMIPGRVSGPPNSRRATQKHPSKGCFWSPLDQSILF